MVTLTMGELERLEVLTQLAERRLPQRRAAERLGLSTRQVRRLVRRFAAGGPRPSPRASAAARVIAGSAPPRRSVPWRSCASAMRLRPTLAREKLTELHDLACAVETLRGWMITAGIWIPRTQRTRRSYPPRPRRACLGELVQLDGSDHAWFETAGRRARCSSTSMTRPVASWSSALPRSNPPSTTSGHPLLPRAAWKPMAFYSDKLSVFHVAAKDRAASGPGVSQFGRALRDLNIDGICANSPEARAASNAPTAPSKTGSSRSFACAGSTIRRRDPFLPSSWRTTTRASPSRPASPTMPTARSVRGRSRSDLHLAGNRQISRQLTGPLHARPVRARDSLENRSYAEDRPDRETRRVA